MKKWLCVFCSKCFQKRYCLEQHLRQHTNERPFPCSICGKSYREKSTLTTHINTHKNNGRPHKCKQCPLAFSLPNHLKKHLISVHNVLKLPKEECPTCGKVFTQGSKMKGHQLRVHTRLEKTQQCIICEKWFMDFQQLMRHLMVHTEEKPFNCLKCPAIFSDVSQRRTHLIRKHDVGVQLRCPVCNKSASGKGDLEVHMRKHTNEKPFPCSICSKTFVSAATLRIHNGVHKSKDDPFWCKICRRHFASLSYYNVHMQRHEGTQLKHQCSECPLSFQYNSGLCKHVNQKHRQVRPFSCNICERSFQTSHARDLHINTHLKETPYKCEICGKRFKYVRGLRGHMRTAHENPKREAFPCSKCPLILKSELEFSRHYLLEHVGSKDDIYSCFFCSFRANCWEKLESHYTKHTGERPYFCSECPLSFGSSDNLVIHCRKFHSKDRKVDREGERLPCSKCPYILKSALEFSHHYLFDHVGSSADFLKCLFCSFRARSLIQLEIHYTRHTGERPYYCKKCPKSYTASAALRLHFRNVHTTTNSKCL